MTQTTDDLKTMFTRVSSAPPPLGDLSSAAARRGRGIRRRRVGAAGLVAAVAVGAFALPHLPSRPTSAPPAVTPTPSPTALDDSLAPEYLRGGRRTAHAAETNRQGVSLTYTPVATGFGVAASCLSPTAAQTGAPDTGQPGDDPPMAEVLVDGQVVTGASCQGQVALSGNGDLSEPTDLGLTPGIPVTVTMRPATTESGLGVTDWQLAIYEPVPLAEYPFPEPPDTRLQVDAGPIGGEGRRVLWGDAADTEGFTYEFPLERGLELLVQTTQPGELRLYVDDQLVITQRSWTYDLATEASSVTLAELGIAPGDSIEVRVEADGFAPGTIRYALFDHRQ